MKEFIVNLIDTRRTCLDIILLPLLTLAQTLLRLLSCLKLSDQLYALSFSLTLDMFLLMKNVSSISSIKVTDIVNNQIRKLGKLFFGKIHLKMRMNSSIFLIFGQIIGCLKFESF